MKRNMNKVALPIVLLLVTACFLALTPARSEATFLLWDEGVNHPEIDWKYTETEHFIIYWYPEVEFTARKLLSVAEDIYEHDAGIWNYELPKKQNVVILDTEDYSNGFAAYNFNWITLWASHLYYDSRGRTDWVADVFSHELGHIISLNTAATFRPEIIGVVFGGMESSRQDNFDIGVGAFLGSETLPTWMVEGASQYSSMTYGADPYDTNREMLVRAAVLDNNLLSMDQMDVIYDKNSLQAEMVYNQGFSMNAWIGEQWGLDTPARMWHDIGLNWRPTYHSMLKRELGVNRKELYNQWKAYITNKYNKQIETALQVSSGQEVAGNWVRIFDTDPVIPEKDMNRFDRWLIGITNHDVKISPNGKYISLLSSHGTERRGSNFFWKKLEPEEGVINDLKPKQGPKIYDGGYSWHPEKDKIVYALGEANKWTGHYYYDLYEYDIEKEKPTQITHEMRAFEPAWSPDGTKIAFIVNGDGQRKLAVMKYPKFSGHYLLIDFDDDTQIGRPVWSPDGTKIAFLMYRKKQQDVWMINSDGTGLRPVTYDKHDNRDPSWIDDENIAFSSDRTGIFNVYGININTHELTQITNVKTGAMMPSVSKDGTLTYSYFTSYGFRPYMLKKEQWLNRKVEDFEYNVTDEEIAMNLATSEQLPEIVGQDYSVYDGLAGLFPILHDNAGTWVWIPIVNYEDSRLQMGAQMIMVDAVERNLFFTYWYVGEESRYSLFYENYMTPVTLFASLHRIFPTGGSDFEFFPFDVKYMFDAQFYFIGLRYTLFSKDSLSLYYAYQDIRVEQPSIRMRQMTGRALNFEWVRDTIYRRAVDGSINPRGGSLIDFTFTYGSPKLHEPFTGAKMGSDLDTMWQNPNVFTEAEAHQYPDENYLLPDYGFWQAALRYKSYIGFPFWDLAKLNDTWIGIKGWDWAKLNFERWKRQRHTLAIKFVGGITHSNVPEGYGWGNSYGRVNSYDRFRGGGMWVTGLSAYSSNNSAFLGYESYTLEGETVAILGFDYRFPILKEIDVALWAFYFDKLYMGFFGDVGNFWSHPSREQDMWNMNKLFDKTYDGKFDPNEDLITDLGLEIRMNMYLFASGWDSFIKVAHGFQDPDREDHPVRVYIGLGTGYDDQY